MGSGIEWELRRPRKSWARGKNLQSSSVYLVLFESHSHCGSVEKSMTILVSHWIVIAYIHVFNSYTFPSVWENVICLNKYFPGQWGQTGLTRVSDKLPGRIPLHPQPICSKNDMLFIYRNLLQVKVPMKWFLLLCFLAVWYTQRTKIIVYFHWRN